MQIVAHSQGSVIAFAALVGLRDRGALSQVGLVTMGSPLFALYPRMFPGQVPRALLQELAVALGGDADDKERYRWRNIHRLTDYFGIPLDDDDPLPITNVRAPDLQEPGDMRVGPPEYFRSRQAKRRQNVRYETGVELWGIPRGAIGRIASQHRIRSERRLYEVCLSWEESAGGGPLAEDLRRRIDGCSRRELFAVIVDGTGSPTRVLRPCDGPDHPPPLQDPNRLVIHHGYWRTAKLRETARQVGAELLRTSPKRVPVVASFAPRRRMVSWFDPRLLALTGYQAGVSAVFGKWADARHVQAIDAKAAAQGVIEFPEEAPDAPGGEPAEVWVDFVADPGDAFVPTFAVAAAVAQPELLGGLRRADILVLGGDEVYPAASLLRYENQLIGPYALASQSALGVLGGGGDGTVDPKPLLLAIPGNHDWYDGLASFDQKFCAQRDIGMWQTRQERSYWVVRLTSADRTPTWWLWGVDLQLGNRFDRRQLAYFREQACHLGEGDFVILCSPIPTWAHARAEPTAFDELGDFVSRLVADQRARVVLHLSGDSHHFARYERQQLEVGPDGEVTDAPRTDDLCRIQYVTAGGGGAFTHPTHHLDPLIDLPVGYDDGETTLELQDGDGAGPRPDPDSSRRLVGRNLLLHRFLLQNRGFLLLPGTLAAVAAFGLYRGPTLRPVLHSANGRSLAGMMASSTISVALILLLVAGWTGFAKPSKGGSKLVARAAGFGHGLLQAAAMAGVVWASPYFVRFAHWVHVETKHPVHQVLATSDLWPGVIGAFDWLALLTFAGVVGGLAGSLVLAVYLVATNLVLKMHDNEATSAVADQGYKHFVRLRIRGESATAWVLHVPDNQRIAEQFAAHDPRPKPIADGPDPRVELWDQFEVGKPSG